MALALQNYVSMAKSHTHMQITLDALQLGFTCLDFLEALLEGDYEGEATVSLQTLGRTYTVEIIAATKELRIKSRDN